VTADVTCCYLNRCEMCLLRLVVWQEERGGSDTERGEGYDMEEGDKKNSGNQ
jgi:hypothetical protein